MHTRFLSIHTLNYRELRCVQISTVFFFTCIIQEWWRYPRAGWTGFAVMMIYAGFDNGTSILRAYHRFLGAMLGLFSGYILWFIGHLDYRTLITIIPATIFFAYFLAGRAYSVPTVFTVNTSVIGTGYFNLEPTYTVIYFIMDYAMATIIAFAIILIFEYCWFRRYGMMKRFVVDTQAQILEDLYRLIYCLNKGKVQRVYWFRCCLMLTRSLRNVDLLIQNSQFMIRSERIMGEEFTAFVALANRIFIGLKALYMAFFTPRYHKFDYNHLFEAVQADMEQLRKYIVNNQEMLDTRIGVIHANS